MSSEVEYARYGVGTTDQQECWPVRARKQRRCAGINSSQLGATDQAFADDCCKVIEPGDVFVEARIEAFQAGSAHCLACAGSSAGNVSRFIRFGEPDKGRRLTW